MTNDFAVQQSLPRAFHHNTILRKDANQTNSHIQDALLRDETQYNRMRTKHTKFPIRQTLNLVAS